MPKEKGRPGRYKMVTARGQTKSAAEWEDETGVPAAVIMRRMTELRWTPERAIFTPYHPGQGGRNRELKLYELNGRAMCIADWARESGRPDELIRDRVKRGWTLEEALNTPSGELPPRLAGGRRKGTCKGCYHFAPLSESQRDGQWCCHYILDTGHPRGCPGGAGCKARSEGTRKPQKHTSIVIMSEYSFYFLVKEEIRRLACL